MVEVRFFAAARAAVGAPTASTPPGTLESVISAFDFPVITKCSFLVNGVAETDRSRSLVDGDTVDVLPPFAGG
jgi:molybdopterin synthase sulfur carrier subunit